MLRERLAVEIPPHQLGLFNWAVVQPHRCMRTVETMKEVVQDALQSSQHDTWTNLVSTGGELASRTHTLKIVLLLDRHRYLHIYVSN